MDVLDLMDCDDPGFFGNDEPLPVNFSSYIDLNNLSLHGSDVYCRDEGVPFMDDDAATSSNSGSNSNSIEPTMGPLDSGGPPDASPTEFLFQDLAGADPVDAGPHSLSFSRFNGHHPVQNYLDHATSSVDPAAAFDDVGSGIRQTPTESIDTDYNAVAAPEVRAPERQRRRLRVSFKPTGAQSQLELNATPSQGPQAGDNPARMTLDPSAPGGNANTIKPDPRGGYHPKVTKLRNLLKSKPNIFETMIEEGAGNKGTGKRKYKLHLIAREKAYLHGLCRTHTPASKEALIRIFACFQAPGPAIAALFWQLVAEGAIWVVGRSEEDTLFEEFWLDQPDVEARLLRFSVNVMADDAENDMCLVETSGTNKSNLKRRAFSIMHLLPYFLQEIDSGFKYLTKVRSSSQTTGIIHFEFDNAKFQHRSLRLGWANGLRATLQWRQLGQKYTELIKHNASGPASVSVLAKLLLRCVEQCNRQGALWSYLSALSRGIPNEPADAAVEELKNALIANQPK
eukprot:TRINITY_DN4084_c0_g1_i1.p1 TRINITY_DN4084_c0_g1~~TRINITY_DN4084_c0_g1_i1.p1  ORF type:complete len:511 (+),score=39.35 TRINITY_DN4084_c0_g1_i1:99-1631(+)